MPIAWLIVGVCIPFVALGNYLIYRGIRNIRKSWLHDSS